MKTIRLNNEIYLRPLREEDATDMFCALNSQREYFGRWLPFVEYTHKAEDTALFVKAALAVPEENRECIFTIRDGSDFIGLIGFKGTDNDNHKTELGYWLCEQYQGKGIMTEAVRTLCILAFQEWDINRVMIKCAVGNLSSKRIPQRLGFTFEGIERDGELLTGGIYSDIEVYSLLKKEFNHYSSIPIR